jgi:hypothetical protein
MSIDRARRGPAPTGRPSTSTTATTAKEHYQSTPRLSRWSPTARFLTGRETVLGSRIRVHRDPEVTAPVLTEELGPAGARAWARRLLDELDGGGV